MPRRLVIVLLFALLASPLPPAADAHASAQEVLLRAKVWVRGALDRLEAGEPIDRTRGQIVRAELEDEIPVRLKQITESTGPMRAVRMEGLMLVRQQLVVVDRALSPQAAAALASLRSDQRRLDARVDELEQRTAALERRVDDLDERLTILEEAQIRDCLDLRYAVPIGAEGWRIQRPGRTQLVRDFDSDAVTLTLAGYLDSCTGDLIQRGLLLQISLVTRELEGDLTLYATFQNIDTQGPNPGYLTHLARYEYPLSRPGYRLDGQVAEIFIPYDEIPFPARSDRIALALVLLHDGRAIYSLPSQPVSCVFAQRTNCRWGR